MYRAGMVLVLVGVLAITGCGEGGTASDSTTQAERDQQRLERTATTFAAECRENGRVDSFVRLGTPMANLILDRPNEQLSNGSTPSEMGQEVVRSIASCDSDAEALRLVLNP